MSDSLIKIIVAIIGLLSTIITYVLVPYIRTRTTRDQREDVIFWLGIAMTSAEYAFNIPKSGPEKKEFVLNFLKSKKLLIDEEGICLLIDIIISEYNEISRLLTEEEYTTTIMDIASKYIY